MSYAAFLESKRLRVAPIGRKVRGVHPMLFDWQRGITEWACRVGRAAIFADCGMGKTLMQLEWARLMGARSLIVAPLSVARQTVREAEKLGSEVRYIRSPHPGPGLFITNYEMAHSVELSSFDAVVLDESSILKNVDGKTRRFLTHATRDVAYRLACTATPAPNDVAELTNHAEWLGVMSRAEMLAAFFVHDEKLWRPKGHALIPMMRWLSTWARAARKPSDVGGSDDGFELPPLTIGSVVVGGPTMEDGQLFPTLGGVTGRSTLRRRTLADRVEATAKLTTDGEQWIVWAGLNDEADTLAKLIAGSVNVEGSWAPEAKAEALEAFQDGEVRVLVTKPSIAGFGMNFQNCSRMAFCGIGDSYESYYQAIRRCWRFGQTQPVQVHVVVSEPEQEIVANVKRKEREAAQMTDLLVRYAA